MFAIALTYFNWCDLVSTKLWRFGMYLTHRRIIFLGYWINHKRDSGKCAAYIGQFPYITNKCYLPPNGIIVWKFFGRVTLNLYGFSPIGLCIQTVQKVLNSSYQPTPFIIFLFFYFLNNRKSKIVERNWAKVVENLIVHFVGAHLGGWFAGITYWNPSSLNRFWFYRSHFELQRSTHSVLFDNIFEAKQRGTARLTCILWW